MADKKKQHFVPQFYLRSFSVDAERKLISVYVIDAEKHIPKASIRDQARQSYFYGKAGVEDELSKLEGAVSPVIAKAIANNVLPERKSEEHLALLKFVLFQNARTPAKAAEIDEHTEKFVKMVAKDFSDLGDQVDGIRVNDPDTPVMALQISEGSLRFAEDLHWKLLENKTDRLLITSDNPVVLYNTFLEKRNPWGSNTGIACKGLQIFFPLGPRHMVMLYDGDVYRVGGRRHLEAHIEVRQAPDVDALNTLQAANAEEVLFFSADTDILQVQEAVRRARPFRQMGRSEIKEHRAIGPAGEEGTLLQSSRVDLRMGLALDFSVILPSAAGPRLPPQAVYLRNPDLVRHFETTELPRGRIDPRALVEHYLGR